jgi:hypothetical protein
MIYNYLFINNIHNISHPIRALFLAAIGLISIALGVLSIALGVHLIALGVASIALGVHLIALGVASIALGVLSIALGVHLIALGVLSIALGVSSIAADFVFSAEISIPCAGNFTSGMKKILYLWGKNSFGRIGSGLSERGKVLKIGVRVIKLSFCDCKDIHFLFNRPNFSATFFDGKIMFENIVMSSGFGAHCFPSFGLSEQ